MLRAPILRCALLTAVLLLATAGVAAQIPLRIIGINDLHGHLEPGENAITVPHPAQPGRSASLRSGGVAYLATRVRQLRAEAQHSVFISAGDLVGATPLVSGLFRDEPTIEAMNALGLELNAAGNHEFDYGVAELRRLIEGGCAGVPRGATVTCGGPRVYYEGARFPMIASNVTGPDGQRLLAPHVVRSFEGVRVGFIGAVTRSTPGIVMPSGIVGWRFEREAAAINRSAQELLSDGVKALVLVIHEGGETDGGFDECVNPRGEVFEIVRRLDPAITVVMSGHTHRGYNCRLDGRVIVQAASFGRLVSVVDLELDRATGEVRRDSVRSRNVPVPNGLEGDLDPALRAAYPPLAPDPGIEALVRHYRHRAAPLADTVVGRLAARFTRDAGAGGDHPAGRLIADAQLAATRHAGAQVALMNPGGIRSDLAPRAADGRVTLGAAFTMQPFGNALVTMTLTGAQLKALLEQQWSRSNPERARFLQPSAGFSYAWRSDRGQGARVDPSSLRLGGRLIDPQDQIRVTVNSYLAEGGDGFTVLREGTDRVGGPLDIDALSTYLRERSTDAPLAPVLQPRIVRLD